MGEVTKEEQSRVEQSRGEQSRGEQSRAAQREEKQPNRFTPWLSHLFAVVVWAHSIGVGDVPGAGMARTGWSGVAAAPATLSLCSS